MNPQQEKQIIDQYFSNLPFKESTARQFLKALRDSDWFYRFPFDPLKTPLPEMLQPPSLNRGLRILSITEGKGIHKTNNGFGGIRKYKVKDGEVFVTFNDLAMLAGGIYTFRLKQKPDGQLELVEQITHVVS